MKLPKDIALVGGVGREGLVGFGFWQGETLEAFVADVGRERRESGGEDYRCGIYPGRDNGPACAGVRYKELVAVGGVVLTPRFVSVLAGAGQRQRRRGSGHDGMPVF